MLWLASEIPGTLFALQGAVGQGSLGYFQTEVQFSHFYIVGNKYIRNIRDFFLLVSLSSFAAMQLTFQHLFLQCNAFYLWQCSGYRSLRLPYSLHVDILLGQHYLFMYFIYSIDCSVLDKSSKVRKLNAFYDIYRYRYIDTFLDNIIKSYQSRCTRIMIE